MKVLSREDTVDSRVLTRAVRLSREGRSSSGVCTKVERASVRLDWGIGSIPIWKREDWERLALVEEFSSVERGASFRL